jgi:hypothetical protein
MTWLDKSEKAITEFGDKFDKEVEKKGWRSKLSGYFKDVFTKKAVE